MNSESRALTIYSFAMFRAWVPWCLGFTGMFLCFWNVLFFQPGDTQKGKGHQRLISSIGATARQTQYKGTCRESGDPAAVGE